MNRALGVLGRAVLLAALSAGLGLVVNAVRGQGLPLVDAPPYMIYKPCPERSKEATAILPSDLPADLTGLVVVDARGKAAFEAGHLPGARSIPYDPLLPLDPMIVDELRTVPAGRLLVYGDTEIDSGKLLSGELASAGLLGVRYLQGGFEAFSGGRP
jgi:rhodanese-related sulfurtransferase